MSRPDFFIVGAPKCGTTSMAAYLAAHPDLFLSERKELQRFGRDLDYTPRPSEEEYLSYFAAARTEKRVGEASVWYLYSETAADEIHQFCPGASILVMLRNPVDMLYSLHAQMLINYFEDIADFREALSAEADRRAGRRIPASTGWRNVPFSPKYLYYREVANYAPQVQRYIDQFSRDNVHVILFDDLTCDTGKAYGETLQFLGVDDSFAPEFRVLNTRELPRSRALGRMVLDSPAAVWKTARAVLPEALRERVYQGLKRLNTRVAGRPAMDPALRRQLQDDFRPGIESLSELLGRDLTSWCETPSP